MNLSTEELIQQAITDAKAGNKDAAKKALSQVVKQEPNNARAWYLLSQVQDVQEQAIFCLNQVLKIQPDNQQAKERLHKFETETTQKPSKPSLSKNEGITVTMIGVVLAGLVGLCFICVGVPVGLYTFGFLPTSAPIPTKPTNIPLPTRSYTENDAIRYIQNWKPKDNKGLTCKETFDSIVYVYINNLGIYDARVEWSATKYDEHNFTVYARLKGETGWANYSWNLNVPNMRITTFDEYAICPPD